MNSAESDIVFTSYDGSYVLRTLGGSLLRENGSRLVGEKTPVGSGGDLPLPCLLL